METDTSKNYSKNKDTHFDSKKWGLVLGFLNYQSNFHPKKWGGIFHFHSKNMEGV
jgi:hypothetical protein